MMNCVNSTGQEYGGPESSALIEARDKGGGGGGGGPPESCEEEYDFNHL